MTDEGWKWNTGTMMSTSEILFTRRKPVPLPFCPPQILMAWVRERSSAVRLIAWAKERLLSYQHDYHLCNYQCKVHKIGLVVNIKNICIWPCHGSVGWLPASCRDGLCLTPRPFTGFLWGNLGHWERYFGFLSVSFHVLSISTPWSITEVILHVILTTDSVVKYHTSIPVYEKWNKGRYEP